ALARIRKLKRVRVYSRTPENRARFAAEMAPLVGLDIEAVARPEEAVRRMDIVLTATNSSVPVFDGKWLEPGAHVTSIVGSNVGLVKGGFASAKRREIDDATLSRSDVLGIASVQQAIQDEQADIFDPVARGVVRWEQWVEIGAILAGKHEGRSRADQITLFKNNAGQGVADVALGALVLEKVRRQGRGEPLKL
ncbi:MAG TPA: hypothetical protein VI231_11025, partial [Candidatus Binatia bacterium]